MILGTFFGTITLIALAYIWGKLDIMNRVNQVEGMFAATAISMSIIWVAFCLGNYLAVTPRYDELFIWSLYILGGIVGITIVWFLVVLAHSMGEG